MRDKRSNFSYDRSINKGTVLVEQCYFTAVSRLPLEGFF